MGDPRALPGFGQVDLELDLESEETPARGIPQAKAPLPFHTPDEHDEPDEPESVHPPSTSRAVAQAPPVQPHVAGRVSRVPLPRPPPPKVTPLVTRAHDANSQPTRRNLSATINDASTRIVQGDALANITRPQPPPAPPSEREPGLAPPPPRGSRAPRRALHDEPATRAWSDVEEQLLASQSIARVEDDGAGSVPGSNPGSGSGVAARDGRVAAMREAYARGDAEGALALAADISDSMRPAPPARHADHPEASVIVEIEGERSFEVSDPFGGLVPLEEDQQAMPTVLPPASSVTVRPERAALPTLAPASAPFAGSAAPQLSLTERHSIPTVLKSPAEYSKLPIDHRAGFLLAHVDGMQTLEEILDVCAMPATEALELIDKLKAMGVIAFE